MGARVVHGKHYRDADLLVHLYLEVRSRARHINNRTTYRLRQFYVGQQRHHTTRRQPAVCSTGAATKLAGVIAMIKAFSLVLALLLLQACTERSATNQLTHAAPNAYLDYSGRDDLLSGGVKMIPINTPKGVFHVWTKRVGNNPTIKVLMLHGGPGATHEYLEALDSYFPAAGIEYYYYDQLGSAYSDQPKDPDLVDLPRSVEEVEQVRQALKLDKSNFYLFGQSWGGLLAIEYSLKYQQHLKGLIISNMMASIPAYNEYAQKVLMPAMDQKALAEILAIMFEMISP